MKQLIAAKAMIERNGKLLMIREKNYDEGTQSGKFDFPGGRINPGETIQEGLAREVKEETNLQIEVGRPFHVDDWRPVIKGEQVQIIGVFFLCKAKGDLKLGTDHSESIWLESKDTQTEVIEMYKPIVDKYWSSDSF